MELERFSNVTNIFFGLFIAVFHSIKIQASEIYWTDFNFVGFDNIDCSLMKTDIRLKRHNKTDFAFSGTVDVKYDFSNDWQVEFVILYSSKGNNQFIKLPYKISKDDLCNFIDGPFISLGTAKVVASASDFPGPTANEPLCKLYKKKIYSIDNLTFGSNNFPKYLRPGYYKGHLVFSKKSSNESFLSLNARLY